MTDDTKNNILQWLTGKYVIGKGVNTPSLNEVSSSTNNLYEMLVASLGEGFTYKEINSQADEVNNTMTIYYGWGTDGVGFIALVDNQFNLLQIIRAYSSGTPFGKILIMNYDNVGNFFCIEENGTTRRLVLMNNFTVKLPSSLNYSAVLRISYSVPTEVSSVFEYNNIIKDPLESRYLITGIINEDSKGRGTPIGFQVQIVVGQENTWSSYTFTGAVYCFVNDTYVLWDSQGNISFKLACMQWANDTTAKNLYNYVEYTCTNDVLAKQNFDYNFYMQNASTDSKYFKSLIINDTTAYVFALQLGEGGNSEGWLFKVNYSSYSLDNIYYKEVANTFDYTFIKLIKLGNEIFAGIINHATEGLSVGNLLKIINSEVINYPVSISNDGYDFTDLVINKQYNLYNWYLQEINSITQFQQIYNSNNYNGQEYLDLTSLNPKWGSIYNNGLCLFARNLTNVIVNSNVTTSILDVPNKYANDVTIQSKKLFSKTNVNLVSDTNPLTTNIYEELLINFINTIYIENINVSPGTYNLAGASRLNNSISSTNDFTNAKISYYRINYSDSSYNDYTLEINSYSYKLGIYKFLVYVPTNKTITNIQLLSYDKNTIYQTIDLSSLISGNYYNISQTIIIE